MRPLILKITSYVLAASIPIAAATPITLNRVNEYREAGEVLATENSTLEEQVIDLQQQLDDMHKRLATLEEPTPLVESSTETVIGNTEPTISPTIAIQKPDYSELISKVEDMRECWEGKETRSINVFVGKDGQRCDSHSKSSDKYWECMTEGDNVDLEEDIPDEEKQEAVNKANEVIQKLENGVLTDIYAVPKCPGTSYPLR